MELWYTEEHTEDVRFSIKTDKTIYSQQSPFQRIDIFDSKEFGRILTLDGLMMVNEKDEFIYHDMITHVAMATNPEIKKVLIIGGGDGGTAREVARYSHIDHIDMVEIDEMVVKASIEYLQYTACALGDPRVHLHYKDGIEFIKTHKNFYDLILVDSTDPIGPGEGLFTEAFYRDAYDALTAEGILINQNESPYYAAYRHEMQRAQSKIKKVFPIAMAYQYHMPTYPSGHWLFGFASKKYNPLLDFQPEAWLKFGLKTKYYNVNLHKGCFALPTYVEDLLNE